MTKPLPLTKEERERLVAYIEWSGEELTEAERDILRLNATAAALEEELNRVRPVIAAARQYAAARWKWLREGDFDGSRQRAMEAAATRVADATMRMLFAPLLVEEERDD